MNQFLPRLIAWEVTRSCMLNCLHCRAAARYGRDPNELSTDECFRFLDDVKSFSDPIIILTGGEPMLREDIFDLAEYGTKKLSLRMVMAPCGMLITEESARRLKDAGIKRISLSLDGAIAETHDTFRGVRGSYANVLQAMGYARKVGLEFQVNTTVTKHNLKELPEILQLAREKGAVAFHPFLLVPTGRGKDLAEWEISPEDYEKTLTWIYEKDKELQLSRLRSIASATERGKTFQFKPTCAPHYYRIYHQQEARLRPDIRRDLGGQVKKTNSLIHQFTNSLSPSLHSLTKGCMGGQYFAFISHTGKVQICGFLELECGDIRKEPFSQIWQTSKIFKEMRDWDNYHGRCGTCEFRKVCGGCRARAYALTGDYLAEEPYCIYQPKTRITADESRG